MLYRKPNIKGLSNLAAARVELCTPATDILLGQIDEVAVWTVPGHLSGGRPAYSVVAYYSTARPVGCYPTREQAEKAARRLKRLSCVASRAMGLALLGAWREAHTSP